VRAGGIADNTAPSIYVARAWGEVPRNAVQWRSARRTPNGQQKWKADS